MAGIRLDIDADRDGEIDPGEPGRWDWVWAADGAGAILVPDLDIEAPGAPNTELAEMRLAVDDPLDDGLQLLLSIDRAAAAAVTIYRRGDGGELEAIAGAEAGPDGRTLPIGGPLKPDGETLYVRARTFPDISFRGLIEIFLVAVDDAGQSRGILDSVLFRVAPWIMTPNTLPAERVYAVSLADGENEEFLAGLRAACDEAGVPLQVVESDLAGGDRWIQDEIEFGYAQGPAGTLPVVCDGPRNRQLDYLAEAHLQADGLGVVEVGSHLGDRSSLDSFGNLEVSPPVRVDGVTYPLGRIVLGNRRRNPSDPLKDRRPALRLREFLYAQEVQSPFEIYSDWLAVGHVDEVISFVPARSDVGFEVLIASPRDAEALFRRLADEGHEDAVCWPGRERIVNPETGQSVNAEETVRQLLDRRELWPFNATCQEILDEIREDLQRELGLDASAIKPIPVLFRNVGRPDEVAALAYFPDMVNHLVLGDVSVVPKPYGPAIDGVRDPLEQAFVDAVPHRTVRFIDDWLAYHEMSGEVHCGTNTLRKPPLDVRWWEHRPLGSHDASLRSQEWWANAVAPGTRSPAR
jgi:protein-arginine deiminase